MDKDDVNPVYNVSEFKEGKETEGSDAIPPEVPGHYEPNDSASVQYVTQGNVSTFRQCHGGTKWQSAGEADNCFSELALVKVPNVTYKDPMRDSLMSNSDNNDECEIIEENHSINPECGDVTGLNAVCDNSLDLELDLWEGQFEFASSPPMYKFSLDEAPHTGHHNNNNNNSSNGPTFYKTIVKSVQMLQQQVGVLADNQINSDDRFSRVKQDNGALQARVVMLEEQLREVEIRAVEQLDQEQRRNKELISHIEREKSLTVENYGIRQANLEKEKTTMEIDLLNTKKQHDTLQKDKDDLDERVSEAEFTASALTQENSKMADQVRREKEITKVERERSGQVIEELRCEVERLRVSEEASRKRSQSIEPQGSVASGELQTVQANLQRVRDENQNLTEQLEDLQAQLLTSRLEEGRNLVTSTNNNSLAAEFEAMTNEEDAQYGSDSIEKLRRTLKDSQEANLHLRSYIDGILLNIVENYPQLLEVKQKS